MKNERYIDVKKFKRIHFKNRLKYWYGIICNRFDIKEIRKKIYIGDYIDVIPQSNTKILVLLAFMDEIVYIVYSLKHNTPVTALPLINYVRRFRIDKE